MASSSSGTQRRTGDWDHEEELILITQHSVLGPRWSHISRVMDNGRTDNDVKNKWNNVLRSKTRRPASLVWNYQQQLPTQQASQALTAALGAWKVHVPVGLANSIMSKFVDWMDGKWLASEYVSMVVARNRRLQLDAQQNDASAGPATPSTASPGFNLGTGLPLTPSQVPMPGLDVSVNIPASPQVVIAHSSPVSGAQGSSLAPQPIQLHRQAAPSPSVAVNLPTAQMAQSEDDISPGSLLMRDGNLYQVLASKAHHLGRTDGMITHMPVPGGPQLTPVCLTYPPTLTMSQRTGSDGNNKGMENDGQAPGSAGSTLIYVASPSSTTVQQQQQPLPLSPTGFDLNGATQQIVCHQQRPEDLRHTYVSFTLPDGTQYVQPASTVGYAASGSSYVCSTTSAPQLHAVNAGPIAYAQPSVQVRQQPQALHLAPSQPQNCWWLPDQTGYVMVVQPGTH